MNIELMLNRHNDDGRKLVLVDKDTCYCWYITPADNQLHSDNPDLQFFRIAAMLGLTVRRGNESVYKAEMD